MSWYLTFYNLFTKLIWESKPFNRCKKCKCQYVWESRLKKNEISVLKKCLLEKGFLLFHGESLISTLYSPLRITLYRKGRLSLYWSQVAYPARSYWSCDGMKWLGVLLLPPGWAVSPSQGYPLHFIRLPSWCPSIQLHSWVVTGTVKVKFFSQEHNTTTQPGLKYRPLDLESSALALTNKSSSLPYHCQYKSLVFLSECFQNLFSNSLIIHDLMSQPESPVRVRWMTLKLNETLA